MKKIGLFISAIIAFLSLTTTASASKFISASIVDKDYIMLYFRDGDVVFNEGPSSVSGCDLHTSCSNSRINRRVNHGTALNTTNVAIAGNWRITSDDDPNYGGKGAAPSNVYRKSKLGCMAQMAWVNNDYTYDWAYEHTLFLKLPQSLKQDKSYTIHIPANINSDVTAQTLVFDIFNNRSEAVKINIVGYSTANSIKSADVYLFLGNGGMRDYDPFIDKKVYIYNVDTQESQEVGKLEFWKNATAEASSHQIIRSKVWNIDFTGFNTAGNYRLAVEDIGCSDNFTISNTIYYEPFKVSTQGFYYMRIGERDESISPVTRRPLYIPGESPENCKVHITTLHPYHPNWTGIGLWDNRNAPWTSAAYQTGRTNPNAWGGHSDALDWDRYLGHVSIIYDMLLPYFVSNGALSDDDLKITESGNGIPDIIDEARYEVDFWLRLRDGMGYSHGLNNPNNSNEFHQAGTTAVAAWANAANASMLGDCFRILFERTGLSEHEDLMAEYRDSAVIAYNYACGLEDQQLTKSEPIGDMQMTGRCFRNTAAAFLYNLTGDTRYEDDLNEYSRIATASYVVCNPSSYNELYSVAGYLFTNREVNYPELYENMKGSIIRDAKIREANYSNTRPSRRSTDNNTGWFVTVIMNQRSIVAHAISEEGSEDRELFENALILEADFSLGRNPLNMIHMTAATTGLAEKRYFENAYTSGWNDGVPGVHPGHTPYMNHRDWGGSAIMGKPTWMTDKNYPAVGNWPIGELYYNTRYVYAANEFTPQQSMRGKQALYGYLYAIRPDAQLPPTEQVAKPIASIPPSSTINKNTTVTLSSNTVSATIYYTLDGSEPSATSGSKYTEPVAIANNATLKAIAVKGGMLESEIAVFEYTVSVETIREQVTAPVASIFSGLTVQYNTPVMLSNHTAGATIYYTIDGSDPSASSIRYTGPIVLTKTVTIKAIAVKSGMSDSEIVIFEYIVEGTALTSISSDSTIDVYPNPVETGGTLHIETGKAGIPIEIYSQNGVCVKQLTSTGKVTAITLDIQAGNYIVKMGAKETKIIVK